MTLSLARSLSVYLSLCLRFSVYLFFYNYLYLLLLGRNKPSSYKHIILKAKNIRSEQGKYIARGGTM